MKPKINLNREKISSEEIAKRRDFNSLMKSYTVVKKPFWKHWSFITGTGVVVASLVAVIVLNTSTPLTTDTDTSKKSDQNVNGDHTYDPTAKFIGNSPFIHPPISGVDVPFTDFTVDANKNTELKASTGSVIGIPKGAFKNADGSSVSGKVNVRYREFHDAVDFFVSGIPMTYDSAGTKYTFESAGMVEIYAFQDGKVLKVNPEKLIKIEMRSNTDAAGYNVYSLDTTAKNWKYEGKDKIRKDDKTVSDNTNSIVVEPIAPFVSEQQPQVEKVQTEIKDIQKEIVKIQDTQPVKPKRSNPRKQSFNLDVDPKEFPEIAIYDSVIFEVGDQNKDFTPEMYKIVWDDAVISEGTTKGSYIISLSKGTEKHKVVTYPVFEGKGYDNAMKKFESKFSEYTTKLTTKKDLEKKKQEEYDALVLKVKKEQEEYDKRMLEQQKLQQELIKKQEASRDAQQKVYRMFTVNNFGVYNCDAPHMYPKGANVNASFVDANNKPLQMIFTIYLVDREKNALFSYYSNPCDKFEFNPNSKNIIWSVTENKELVVFFDEQFSDIKAKSGAVTFKMKTIPEQDFNSLTKMKSLLKVGDGLGQL